MIKENARQILQELPDHVELVAATKGRTVQQIRQAIEAGVKIIGENYVQEAEEKFKVIGNRVKWHFIGHLQKNKAKKAVEIFAMLETVDSLELALEIDKVCVRENKIMPVLVEINSGQEKQKFGVLPQEAERLVRELSYLKNIKVMGLFTMGPRIDEPEQARPYFSETKRLFEQIRALNIANVQMQYLSMGMSNTYRVAIKEGASMVRIGSKIFGKREN